MLERRGWLCPSCGKAHGPHIATCPDERLSLMGFPVRILPDAPVNVSGAGCSCKPGEACGNAACPYMPKVTCAASSAADRAIDIVIAGSASRPDVYAKAVALRCGGIPGFNPRDVPHSMGIKRHA